MRNKARIFTTYWRQMLSVLRNDRISSDLNVSMYQCHLSQLTDLSTKATNPRQTEVVQVGTRQCWVSSKLQLTRKIQCFKYRLTGNYTNLLQQNTAMTKFFPSLHCFTTYTLFLPNLNLESATLWAMPSGSENPQRRVPKSI